jgi:CRP/FNR family cyclic AMP-dependent transcriptional regulator
VARGGIAVNAPYQRIDPTPESLAGIQLLSGLERQERVEILRHCEGRKYQKDQEIISHQEDHRDAFFVVSGRVSAAIYSPSGRRVTFQVLGPGDTFGELAALDKEVRSASVVTMEESFVVRISEAGFSEMVDTYPAVTKQLLRRMSKLVRFLCERIYELHAFPVKDRICAEIWRLGETEGRSTPSKELIISPAPTHAELACRVGTIRETVTRELQLLKNMGLIDGRRGELIIKNRGALHALVERAAQGLEK